MSALSNALTAAGAALTPLVQDGAETVLTWDPGATGPIFEDSVLLVLPDMHLAGGGAGDIFAATQGATPKARFKKLVTALAAIAPKFPTLTIIQLGDLYDVWRAYPGFKDHPTSDYDIIENFYGDCLAVLLQDLRARVCVGNHDAALGLFPPAWARGPSGLNDQLAYGHRIAKDRVIAFHGHQEQTIGQAMASQGGSTAVRLATEVARLSNPLSIAIQHGIDLGMDWFADDHLSMNDLLNANWPQADAPSDARGFSSPRWCARDGRDTLQRLVSAIPNAGTLRLVIVGHSHRPGISAIHVNGQLVPLVDAGSWVWGRSQIAIGVEGELRLWNVT